MVGAVAIVPCIDTICDADLGKAFVDVVKRMASFVSYRKILASALRVCPRAIQTHRRVRGRNFFQRRLRKSTSSSQILLETCDCEETIGMATKDRRLAMHE